MFELIRNGLLTGLRLNATRALLLLGLAVIGGALLASAFSGRQPMTVGLDVGFSGLRLVLLLLALMWVQLLLGQDIERKTVYFMLAYPYTRGQFLFSRFATLALLCAGATLLLGMALWLVLRLANWDYVQLTMPQLDYRYALAMLGIWLDLLVVLAFSVLLCSLSTTPFLPFLMGLAFALAARGLGTTFDFLRDGRAADPEQARLFGPIVEYTFMWLPDLSRLDWRTFTLYDVPPTPEPMLWAVAMALAYVTAMLALANVLFQRRDFT
ncbi:ABC transporter permease [Thauera sp. SDU_THAU2]|uniref:ABC transporter permease n=1 Tax=Thauera sp. SDU_THAU2 TaxID=3136633 RepID=UPI00311EABCD